MTNSSAVWSPCTSSIHDPISELAESRIWQRFGKHISDVISGGYVRDNDAAFLYKLANKEMAALHVFHMRLKCSGL